MATIPVIPESENNNIINLYSEGHSTREISELLKERGVNASYAAVWRLIQRIASVNGDAKIAEAITHIRQQAVEDLDTLSDIETNLIVAGQADSSIDDVNEMMARLPLLAAAHRMRCTRLRAAGVLGAAGNRIHQRSAHLLGGGDEAEDVTTAEPAAVTPEPKPELLRLKDENTGKSREISRNSPSVVTAQLPEVEAANAPPPARTRPCPCGSGMKYKKCCGKDSTKDEQERKSA